MAWGVENRPQYRVTPEFFTPQNEKLQRFSTAVLSIANIAYLMQMDYNPETLEPLIYTYDTLIAGVRGYPESLYPPKIMDGFVARSLGKLGLVEHRGYLQVSVTPQGRALVEMVSPILEEFIFNHDHDGTPPVARVFSNLFPNSRDELPNTVKLLFLLMQDDVPDNGYSAKEMCERIGVNSQGALAGPIEAIKPFITRLSSDVFRFKLSYTGKIYAEELLWPIWDALG